MGERERQTPYYQKDLWSELEASQNGEEDISSARTPQAHTETQRIAELPVDPEVQALIPEDMQPLVTHIPRYLQSPEEQQQPVIHLIPTRFIILSFDDNYRGYRKHIPGILLETDDGSERVPKLYLNHSARAGDVTESITYLRNIASVQGLLPGE